MASPKQQKTPLQQHLQQLEKHYGPLPAPVRFYQKLRRIFDLVLWENLAYLADDERRLAAYRLFESSIGLDPESILEAPRAKLLAVAKLGIVPDITVEKYLAIAKTARDQFAGNLEKIRKLPPDKAHKAFKLFPAIGDPGADKLMLFAGIEARFAVESNGLRALLRLGIGEAKKSYSAAYKSAAAVAAAQLEPGFEALQHAFLLLRHHGQSLCRRKHPECGLCPLAERCAYAQSPEKPPSAW